MASWRSATDLKTLRRMTLRVRTEKKFSTALSGERRAVVSAMVPFGFHDVGCR
jgi:hypothetical protein